MPRPSGSGTVSDCRSSAKYPVLVYQKLDERLGRGQQNDWIQLIFSQFATDVATSKRGSIGRELEWAIARRPVVRMDALLLTRYVLLPGPQRRGTGSTFRVDWRSRRDRGHPPMGRTCKTTTKEPLIKSSIRAVPTSNGM